MMMDTVSSIKKRRSRQAGSAEFLVVFILGLFVLALAGGSYYFLKSVGKYPVNYMNSNYSKNSQNGISDSEDFSVIEEEIKSTQVGSFDSDIKILEKDSASL